jgi:hypothetical protein
MKAFACSLVLLLLLSPAPVGAQCSTCGPGGDPNGLGPYGLKGGPGPGLHGGPGVVVGPAPGYSVKCNACGQVGACGPCESCGHWCQYYSEQEKMANDWCRDCCFNWGWQHTLNNALTPHFAPTWHAAVDAQWLLRDGERRVDFASFGPRNATGSNIFLTSSDLDECMETGFRTTVSRSLGSHDNFRIEASYFGTQEWEEHLAFRDPTNNASGVTGTIASPFTNFGRPTQVVGLDFNNFVEIGFTSELHSAELNFRHRTGLMCGFLESSMVYGIRYMKIDETFFYQQISGLPLPLGATHEVDTATTNELLGAQLGVLASYRVSDRWWWELDVKATLAGNDATVESIYGRSVAGVPNAFAFRERHNCMAVIGDVNLMSMYQITHNLALRAGYQMIWVDGIAVAVEQFNPNLAELTLGPARLNDDGTLVYHGPHLGLVVTW